MKFTIKKSYKTFNGYTHFAEHDSDITKTKMNFSYFMPESKKPEHGIIWLSGLTCNEENFISKAGAQEYLAKKNALIICPDTSPRGLNLLNEHDAYDFGSGAGFYVNALSEGYKNHYRMYDYIIKEIYQIIKDFGVSKVSISGHSVGGHGALIMGIREANLFASVSAFSPLVNPSQSPWGQKAFSGYLGNDIEKWKNYDACNLIAMGKRRDNILIYQGLSDEFFVNQLKTKNFEEVCAKNGQKLEVHYKEGYDHSYYFISSFIKKHLEFLLNSD